MSTPITTLQACAAEEARITGEIDNTSRKLGSLRTSLPELEARFARARAAYNADVANGRKAVFPTVERNAITQVEAEIGSLDASITKLRDELTAARKETKQAEGKARDAREMAELVELCDALEPALIVNDRLKAEHDQGGTMHRSNALPWLDRALIDGLRSFAKAQIAPPERKPLPRDSANVIFNKTFPGSHHGSALGSLCSYRENEVANFPRRIVDALVKAEYATEVAP